MSFNWANLVNPYAPHFKKHILQLVKDQKYAEHEESISKLASLITDEKSYREFGNFISALWESGFLHAVEENVEALKKLGLKATISDRHD